MIVLWTGTNFPFKLKWGVDKLIALYGDVVVEYVKGEERSQVINVYYDGKAKLEINDLRQMESVAKYLLDPSTKEKFDY